MSKSTWNRREFLRTTAVGGLGLTWACGSGEGGSEDGAPPGDSGVKHEPFTVVALPDTQYYSDHYPEVYEAQTQWIADNRDKERIVFVTHLGDIVDNGPSNRQWINAGKAMAILEQAGVPYGTCVGNHDVQYSDSEFQYPASVNNSCSPLSDIDCDAAHYIDSFGPKRYSNEPWYGGASPSGQSNCQIVTAGGLKLLFLHLAVDPRAAELAWGQQVLDKHPDAAVHVSTHRYMYDLRLTRKHPYPLSTLLGGRYTDLIYDFDQAPYFNDATRAEQLFESLVFPNPNIFMVQCGHVDAEVRQEQSKNKNKAGLPVHEILVDFQEFSPKGGDGWLRRLRFDVDAGEIKVSTYSPTLKRLRKNGEGYDDSLKALKLGISQMESLVGKLFDVDQLKQQVDYWSTDPAGRKEGFDLMYADGRRDSEFTLKVDFKAHLEAVKK